MYATEANWAGAPAVCARDKTYREKNGMVIQEAKNFMKIITRNFSIVSIDA